MTCGGILSFLRCFLLFVILGAFGQTAWGQVRLFQWTDVHSTLQTMSRQVFAIDRMAQEFKTGNPGGEVIVYVIGDFTSPSVYVRDEGWFSIEAMKLLRERGYTVLFTPGNHDAFDWVSKPGDTRLFIEQMRTIRSWGVGILAENLVGRTPVLDSLLSPSYPLETVEPVTHIVGLTLDRLMQHSNLYEEEARTLFESIENYQQTLDRILPEMSRSGVEFVILGVHENNRRVSNIFKQKNFERSFGIQIPLAMAAHDHLVATYKEGGTMISDAGSHGSFSVIDISKSGKVSEAIEHIAVSSKALRAVIDKDIFHFGIVRTSRVTEAEIENSWLNEYHQKIKGHLSMAINRMDRPLVTLENAINETKIHMQHGRSHLGSLVAEAMSRWGRGVLAKKKGLIIAMYNSSSYRMEEPILKGPVTELTIRQMYPYSLDATLYEMRGQEVERLYFSLRREYATRSRNRNRHSPQLNPDVREFEGRLQVNTPGGWRNIDRSRRYWVVFDPWLSHHRFNRGYKIKEWVESLRNKEPRASESLSEILVEFLPSVLLENDRGASQLKKRKKSQRKKVSFNHLKENVGRPLRCQSLFPGGH